MSYSYALPAERFSSGLTRRWLVVCTLSQLVCLGAMLGGGALAQRMQWLSDSPEKIALHLVIAAIFGLTYGYWRGSVLRAGLARFPMPIWCIAVAAVAVIFTPPAPTFLFDIKASSPAFVISRELAPAALNGLIYGLVVGVVEALVMRRAAFGLTLWALLSGFAWSVASAAATLGYTLAFTWLVPPLTVTAASFLWSLAMAPVAAVLMLPALRNLTPQLSYYGPRVFRPFLPREPQR